MRHAATAPTIRRASLSHPPVRAPASGRPSASSMNVKARPAGARPRLGGRHGNWRGQTRWRYSAGSATIVTREGADACDAQTRERTRGDLRVYDRIP